MKNFKFKWLLLSFVLSIASINQVWAGDPYVDGFGFQFQDDGGKYYKLSTNIMDHDFGSKTNLKILYIYCNCKCNYGNLCRNLLQYEIYGTTGTADWGGTDAQNTNWNDCNPVTYSWGTENGSSAYIDLVQNRKPGDYNMQFIFHYEGNNTSGYCGTWYDCKYDKEGTKYNWYFTWSIPDPTITITGADALVAGTSTNISATISNYPVGATLTNLQVTGNIASAKSNTGTGSSITVSSITPNASGNNAITVTATVKFGTAGTKDYVYTYNVAPPAISNYTVTPTGTTILSGTGTSDDPFIMSHEGSLTLALSGATRGYNDANSTIQYSVDGSSYGTTSSNKTKTISSITTTDKTEVTVYSRCYNSSASLSGSVNSKTYYYKTSPWCIAGTMCTISWSQNEYLLSHFDASGNGYVDIPLDDNEEYNFKVVNRSVADNNWWTLASDGSTIPYLDYENDNKKETSAFNNTSSNTDTGIKSAGAGTYRFAWDATNNKLTVTFPDSYKVTYSANGSTSGEVPEDDDYYASETSVTVKGNTGTLAKTGYNALAYWNSANDGSGTDYAIGSGTFSISADKTLYAKWTQNVTLNQNGADKNGDATVTMIYNSNANVSISNPKKIGKTFAGWTKTQNGTDVVINASGVLQASQTYTDASRKWTNSGSAPVLYAKWEDDNNTFTNATGNGDWNTVGNWSAGVVPTNSYAAVQLTGALTVSSHIYVGTLDLTDANAKLTIQAGGALEVAGTITNTDVSKIVINSTTSNQGALIFNSTGETAATVNMTMNAESDMFQFIAIPVPYINVADKFPGSTVYTYGWSNTKHEWERRGYYDGFSSFEAVLVKGQGSALFTGNLVATGNRDCGGSYAASYGNVYMYGNSWTAPITMSAEGFSNASIGIMNRTTNGWDGVLAGEVIPALQAFAVAVNSSGGSITINYDRDVRNPSNPNVPLKAPKHQMSETQEPITVYVSGNEMQTRIRLFEDATRFSDEFDNGWEALYMEGYGYAGEMYAMGTDKMNVLATNNLEGTVVGFVPGQAENYTISFEGDGKGYYLNDIKMEEATLIEEGNTYEFSADEKTNSTRFVISKTPIKKTPTSVENIGDGVKARKQMIDGTLYIIRDGRIYNAEGSLIK